MRTNGIDDRFKELRGRGKKALIAYLTVGFPDLQTNLKQILEMEKRGVGMVELGIPFSDPVADGPIIQASSQAALEKGITLSDAFSLAERVRERSSLPLILMGYLNPFLNLRPDRLALNCQEAGIDGVIIPDLPPEEAGFLREPLKKRGVHTIFLLAPTSPKTRMRLVSRKSTGFIYYVSRTGVTGERKDLADELKGKVKEIRRLTGKPICVGFGISTRSQLLRVWEVADGAIVGSALIKPFLEAPTSQAGLKRSLKKLDELLPRP